jgi:hypothetical protein
MYDITDYFLERNKKSKIISSREELDALAIHLNLDPKNIFRIAVAVNEAQRASAANKAPKAIIPVDYHKTGVSLDKKPEVFDLQTLPGYISTFAKIGVKYSIADKNKLHDTKLLDRELSPFPRMLHVMETKGSKTEVLIYSKVLENFTERKDPVIAQVSGFNSPLFRLTKHDSDYMQKIARAFPQQIAKLGEALSQIADCKEEIKALVDLNSDSPITPTTKVDRLTKVSIVYADSSNPTAKQLKSDGTYKFLLGNLGDTEFQVLAEYQNQVDVQYYLDRIDTDDDAYRLFVFPNDSESVFKKDYRNSLEFKLYVKNFKGFNYKQSYRVRPIKELPKPDDVNKSPNPVEAAIKYYLETGKAISYVHFR